MARIDNVLYTGKTQTTGGREGAARNSDGRLDIQLSPPGSSGKGTNPEQLFAAGWSACFIGAMGLAARDRDVSCTRLELKIATGKFKSARKIWHKRASERVMTWVGNPSSFL